MAQILGDDEHLEGDMGARGGLRIGPGWPWQGSGGGAWRALLLQNYMVFMLSMLLALWLMDLELGGAHGGPGTGTCPFYCSFIMLFDARQGAATGWRQIWKAMRVAAGEG